MEETRMCGEGAVDGEAVRKIKCLLVGDATVGKSSLSLVNSGHPFPDTDEFMPRIWDYSERHEVAGNGSVILDVFDTPGSEDYDRLRVLSYPHTDVILLCFSVVCATTYYNIRYRWLPELQTHLPGVPVILVGTKVDLREDFTALERLQKTQQRPVAARKGERLAGRVGARRYAECSARTGAGVRALFEAAVQCAVQPPGGAQRPRGRGPFYKLCCLSNVDG